MAGSSLFKDFDINQMREALLEVYNQAGLMLTPSYTTTPAPGAPVTIHDIAELRQFVKDIEH